ncbi:hypothetical protein EHQ24_12045 [Leptospira noumeaensis]|uniref:SH3 domain-containing protein n=1 Tax=Leptospira noumeaensis TaxID=2484964 RepID=A0A4R9I797_9LEPT|nr:hypothetical protein [Leptospira noumeaensis]TGK81998.1 hypothetical protein EHQ24_12045 [Leptospira noumeaensis]
MKIIVFAQLLFYLNCSYLLKDSQKESENLKIEQAAGENIKVYKKINEEHIFTIEEGEIFLIQDISENKEWKKIYLENKSGYISNSNIFFTLVNSSKNISDKSFVVHNKSGAVLCENIPRNRKCLKKIKSIIHLEKIKYIKPYQINDGSGTWLKVESGGSVGFINRLDLIPESIFNIEQVESFKREFQKICSTKVSYLSENTNICYSSKMFNNGDASENWKERVYFMIDHDSNAFGYGRKYIETFGVIFKVDSIQQNIFKVYYLDLFDFSEKNIVVETNIKKKILYAPLPETLMPESYKRESSEKIEFKTGLKYSQ